MNYLNLNKIFIIYNINYENFIYKNLNSNFGLLIQINKLFLNIKFSNFIKIYLPIFYENSYFSLILKPYNIIVHSYFNYSLINNFLYFYKKKIFNLLRIGIINRLDKNTSGFFIIFKCNLFYLNYLKQIIFNVTSKYYISIVKNKLNFKGKITSFLKIYNFKKICHTLYKLIFYNTKFNISFLKCLINKGRTHQIRLHFNSINSPLIGDNFYFNFENKNQYLFLNVYYLSFYNIISDKFFYINSSLNQFFKFIRDSRIRTYE